MDARRRLIDELRTHALVVGEVVLTSGQVAQYYVDAKRAILRPPASPRSPSSSRPARASGGDRGRRADDGRRRARVRRAGGRRRREGVLRAQGDQAHGLQRRIEGPQLEPGDRCLIVEDVVTTGGSTLQAIAAVREAGHQIAGVVTVLDRLAGGAERIRDAADGAPYEPLATIDDIYPDRPDRDAG